MAVTRDTRDGRLKDAYGVPAVVVVNEDGTAIAGGGAVTTADGANVTQGAIADAAVAAGAAGTLSAKLRSISRDLVANIVLAAGSAIIGKVGIDQPTPGTTNLVDTELPAAAALADAAANPTSPMVGAAKLIFNGATWDRARGDITNGLDVDVTRVASKGYASAVTITRTADANAYAANDILGPAVGSTAGITFANMGPGAGEILITSAIFERDATALISGETSYSLHLYNVTPPSALGDNVAFDLPSGDRASYLGSINLGTPVDLGSTLYVATDGINKQITLASANLFGYLVTVGAYTPASAAVHVITLHSVAA